MWKKVLIGVVGLLMLAALGLVFSGNTHVLYGIRATYLQGKKNPDIDDMPFFDVRKVKAANPAPIAKSARYNLVEMVAEDRAWSDSMGTTALLVFRGDSLVFEQYAQADTGTLSNSFSIAKSITSVLIGKAIEEGYIKSLDDKVSDYLEEYRLGMDTLLTIRHLLAMTSGIPFGESYSSPFGFMAKAYFGKDLKGSTYEYHAAQTPGTLWSYEGGNTVLLGMVLQKAVGMTVSDYCSTRLWGPLGAEQDAYWNLDDAEGIEKTFSGFYATARDFGRIGLLYLNSGQWNGNSIVSAEWVRESVRPSGVADKDGQPCSWYGFQWWVGEHNNLSFYACRGLRGQYVVCVPELDVVVVRTGHTQSKERLRNMPVDLYRYIDIATRILNQKESI
jgi:CubicO group peptidase (beta-lactamase class C family)